MNPLYRVRRALVVLGAVFAIAVTSHHFVAGSDWLDSVYFFIITVSGVGYSETSDAPPQLKLLNIAMIVIGMFAVGYALTLLLQVLIEGQIDRALGVRRMTREIKQLENHIIICGFGRMGETLAEEFRRQNVPFVIVDNNADKAVAARAEGMLVVTGDATDEDTLIDAGIERARTLIVAMHSDADNVFLTLTARNLCPNLRIVARGELPATEKKLRQAGANQVVLPAVIGARRMAALVTRPHAAELIDLVTDHRILDAELEELEVTDSCRIVGKTVREAAMREKYSVMIIAIRGAEGEMRFNPEANTRLEVGDTLIVLGKRADVDSFRTEHVLAV